jgi:hypothetical protein
MTDYIDEYGDEVEDVELRLKHALELVDDAKNYLRRGLAVKAVHAVFEAGTLVREAESGLRGLHSSLRWESNR